MFVRQEKNKKQKAKVMSKSELQKKNNEKTLEERK